jgi:zinc D-Ala-D-Ala dipeptidase
MHSFATAALALLLTTIATPVRAQAPVPAGFVDAAAVVDGLVVDMRYFGTDNFVGEKIDGYERPRCLLSVQAARALAAVQRDLAARGLGLKVFDCYRPVRAVAHFVRWARRIEDNPKRKAEYYPDIDKRDLFKLGYIAARSGHSRGSTVDLTLVRRADNGAFSGKVDTDLGSTRDQHSTVPKSPTGDLGGFPQKMRPTTEATQLDMGTPYDFSGRQSWVADKSVSVEAQKNRALFAATMARGGFRSYHKEWWHFTLANEPFPDTYFDFPVR